MWVHFSVVLAWDHGRCHVGPARRCRSWASRRHRVVCVRGRRMQGPGNFRPLRQLWFHPGRPVPVASSTHPRRSIASRQRDCSVCFSRLPGTSSSSSCCCCQGDRDKLAARGSGASVSQQPDGMESSPNNNCMSKSSW